MPDGYDLSQDPVYQQILQQIQATSGGSAPIAENTSNLQNQVSQFATMYQNLTGQAPTQDVINAFSQNLQTGILNSPTGEAGSNYATNQNLFTPYLENTYGPQITANQQQQQTGQLQNSQQLVQNLINQTMQNTASGLANPNSSIYQSFSGNENNMGITPGSGAFQAGAGSTIANAGMNAANAGLQEVGLPQISGIAGTANAPYGMTLANEYGGLGSYGTTEENQSNFNQESQLGQLLAQMSQPSSAMQDIGMASSAAQGLGSLGTGAGMLGAATWICTQMKREGILSKSEVNRLHAHLYPAFWKRPFKFIGYILFGKFIVLWAKRLQIDFSDWFQSFYVKPMHENDSAKAVDIYAESFWNLVKEIRYRIRIKMLFVYDNPKGEGKWH